MLDKLRHIVNESEIDTNVKMAQFTTFRTGGTANIFITPETVSDIKALLKFFSENKIGYYILGNGSNLLIDDGVISSPVIYIGKNFSSIEINGTELTAGAGANLSLLSRKAMENSLTGLEFASGIPGSVGGAVIMNAGAYGGEIKDICTKVTYIDKSGNECFLSGDEMEFSYRKSALNDKDCVITKAVFNLEKGSKEEILKKMKELLKRRKDKQPLEFPSAGSTFKRPEGYFAAALIEKAGLKGYSVGGAQVSEKHSGFIINKNEATTKDIRNLIEYVKKTVFKESGIMLETEVKYWD